MPARCSISRSRRAWPSCPARRSPSGATTGARCVSRSAHRRPTVSTRACAGCAAHLTAWRIRSVTIVARAVDAAAVRAAAARIAPHVRHTPTERFAALSEMSGREVFLKLENLQHTGAFKIRGALNAILQLDAAARAGGVITASAGNHGQGVAFAARLVGIPACVVLPHGVPIAKLVAIQRSGAETVLVDGGYDGAHSAAVALAAERGMRYIHAFDDDDVIAGQGTVALELLEDAEVDTVVVPIGGGGLAAGIALALSDRSPRPRIVGVQSEGASAFAQAFEAGAPRGSRAGDHPPGLPRPAPPPPP